MIQVQIKITYENHKDKLAYATKVIDQFCAKTDDALLGTKEDRYKEQKNYELSLFESHKFYFEDIFHILVKLWKLYLHGNKVV